jgi:hypothetical protein
MLLRADRRGKTFALLGGPARIPATIVQADLLEKRRTLMERWGRFCAGGEVRSSSFVLLSSPDLWGRSRKPLSLLRGTEGSNPSLSANAISIFPFNR